MGLLGFDGLRNRQLSKHSDVVYEYNLRLQTINNTEITNEVGTALDVAFTAGKTAKVVSLNTNKAQVEELAFAA